MPRNSSGVYQLPAGNPVASGTLIESVWANSTMSDLAQAMTESLDRFGRSVMAAPLLINDGTIAAPGIAFGAESSTGLYRESAKVMGVTVGGTEVFRYSQTGVAALVPFMATDVIASGSISATGSLTVTGSASFGGSVTFGGSATYTGAPTFSAGANLSGALTLDNAIPIKWKDAGGTARTGAVLSVKDFKFGDVENAIPGGTTTLAAQLAILQSINGNTITTATANGLGVGVAPATALHVWRSAANTVFRLSSSGAGGRDWDMTSSTAGTLSFGSDLAANQLTLVAGNVGLAVTPSAWTALKAIEGSAGALAFNGPTACYLTQNAFFNGAWTRKAAAPASVLTMYNGDFEFANLPTGTAGSSGSLVTLMTLDPSGNLLLGTNTSAWGSAGRGVIEVNGSTTALIGVKVGGIAMGYMYHTGTDLHLMNLSPTGNLTLDTNGTTHVTVDAGGNVGVNTNPSVMVHAKGAGGTARFRAESTSGAVFEMQADSGTSGTLSVNSNHPLFFQTNSALRMQITAAGVIQDGAGNELGFKGIPNNGGTGGAYTIVQGDNGRKIVQGNAANITTAAGLSNDFTTIVVNASGSAISIVQSGVTLRLAGTASTGNRSLAAWGVCTMTHIGSNIWMASGSGLS